FVAILDLVPVIGSTIAGVAVCLVALSVSLSVCLATIGFFVVYRLVEDYLLVPRIIGRALLLLTRERSFPAWTAPDHPASGSPTREAQRTGVTSSVRHPQPQVPTAWWVPDKENSMSLGDKASNKAEELKGKGKEAAGRGDR
ncbi:MAG: hypothetical protein WBF76_12460, partial [Pseudonocardiaceae bacterium]